MKINERIEKLRDLMKERNIDAYIIPSSDAHQSEYVAEYYKSRQWISGFTGSAGTVVVTKKEAGLWTDGRYYIQAEKQLKGSEIKLFKAAEPNVPSFIDYLNSVLKNNSVVGFNGNVFSVLSVKGMEKTFKYKGIKLNMEYDLIGEMWDDRPCLPKDSIFIHDVKFAGKSRGEKLNIVRDKMKEMGANYYLLSSLDDIAWLLNLRGSDVPNNPVFIAHVVVSLDKCFLFIDNKKVPKDVFKELINDGVEIKDYEDINGFLRDLKSNDSVLFDPNKTSISLYNSINNAEKIELSNITTDLKAIKNLVEIENLKQCNINDGVAMVKFIKWLKESVKEGNVTEISAGEKSEELRSQQPYYMGPSFDFIVGYKDHAAMMHYKAAKETQYTLKDEGFLLIDSGGQYLNGTTDITRTIVLGNLSEEERIDYTLVLKSNIALSSAKFLYGATGSNLDVLARMPIWEQGMDYKCGTGHGVGFFLNVHEGPQRFAQVPNGTKLVEGMVITNEPGIYKEGKHGIRTENMILVTKNEKTEFGEFLGFEAITYCPIDLDGINIDMLTKEEKNWINNYHKTVYEKLSIHLNKEEIEWLLKETREI